MIMIMMTMIMMTMFQIVNDQSMSHLPIMLVMKMTNLEIVTDICLFHRSNQFRAYSMFITSVSVLVNLNVHRWR